MATQTLSVDDGLGGTTADPVNTAPPPPPTPPPPKPETKSEERNRSWYQLQVGMMVPRFSSTTMKVPDPESTLPDLSSSHPANTTTRLSSVSLTWVPHTDPKTQKLSFGYTLGLRRDHQDFNEAVLGRDWSKSTDSYQVNLMGTALFGPLLGPHLGGGWERLKFGRGITLNFISLQFSLGLSAALARVSVARPDTGITGEHDRTRFVATAVPVVEGGLQLFVLRGEKWEADLGIMNSIFVQADSKAIDPTRSNFYTIRWMEPAFSYRWKGGP